MRVAIEDQARIVACGGEKIAMHGEVGEAKRGNSTLTGTEKLTRTAQSQVLFGNAEAVVGLA
jgi:hypothetical protein